MKYANLILDANRKMENIGDWVQIFAIENLYHFAGINYSDVIRIKISELSTYDGEYVILPINYPLYGYYNLSPKIIPIYLGVSVIDKSVAKGLNMHIYQPIGCRDYHTLCELRQEGLEVYYGGCLTITFSERKTNPSNGKVFIVDVSPNIIQKIPNEIKENAVYEKHVLYETECKGEKNAKKIFERYRNEASLVITSKIHCAQPCLAAGIPVVFICEVKSFRYDVLRQYIPIYTIKDMDTIEWNPSKVNLEEQKQLMLSYATERLNATYKKYEKLSQLSDFFLNGEVPDYEIDSVWAFKRYIESRWNLNDTFEYVLWGITQAAEAIYTWINKNYPNAKLKKMIDIVENKEFHGIKTKKLEDLSDCVAPVFVTAGSANPIAEEVFRKYNVKNYVICYNNMYIVDGDMQAY